jgi:hypothetical protein
MTNSITPKADDSLRVVLDPWFILTQPASLPDAKGQLKLTGFSFSNLLVCMAQQIVAAKAPQLYLKTLRPMTGVEVKFDKGQFVIEFKKVEELVIEAPAEVLRTPSEMKDAIKQRYLDYAKEKGIGQNASVD